MRENSTVFLFRTELFAKTKLRYLHLEGNRIHTIYKNTFTELNSLEFLNVSRNKMSFPPFPACNDEPVVYPENYIWVSTIHLSERVRTAKMRHQQGWSVEGHSANLR